MNLCPLMSMDVKTTYRYVFSCIFVKIEVGLLPINITLPSQVRPSDYQSDLDNRCV